MMAFQDFLDASGWGDASKTYEEGISFGAGAGRSDLPDDVRRTQLLLLLAAVSGDVCPMLVSAHPGVALEMKIG